jgi:Fe-S cluster assembly protein SufD
MRLIDLGISDGQTFPHSKQENWRFTNVSFLQAIDFQLLPAIPTKFDPNVEPNHLHIINGELIASDRCPFNIQTIQGTFTELAQKLDQSDRDYFADINLHHQPTTIVISIPDNYHSQHPLEIHYQVTIDQLLVQPRLNIQIGKNSQLTIIEKFTAPAYNYLHNLLLTIYMDCGATLQHIRYQNENNTATHIATTIIHQSANSNYTGIMLDFGSKLSRHNPVIYTQAEGTNSQLYGLAIIDNDRIIDTHSSINHTHPNSTSQQLHKAIINDRGQGIFNGRIFVDKLAQNIDSAQLSRTLLLSPTAKVNTKPQLEIIANNVKCKHGATISQLDPEECFYLQSRGIDPNQAVQLLTYSFAIEVLTGIRDDRLRQEMIANLKNALPSARTTAQP